MNGKGHPTFTVKPSRDDGSKKKNAIDGGEDDDLHRRWKAYIEPHQQSDDDDGEYIAASRSVSSNNSNSQHSHRSLFSRSSLASMEVQVDSRLRHCPAEAVGAEQELQERIARKLVAREYRQQFVVHRQSSSPSGRDKLNKDCNSDGSTKQEYCKPKVSPPTVPTSNKGPTSRPPEPAMTLPGSSVLDRTTTTPTRKNLSLPSSSANHNKSSSSSPHPKDITFYHQELARLAERRSSHPSQKRLSPSSSSQRQQQQQQSDDYSASHNKDSSPPSQRSLTSWKEEDILVLPRSQHGPNNNNSNNNKYNNNTQSVVGHRGSKTTTTSSIPPHPANAFDWLLDNDSHTEQSSIGNNPTTGPIHGRHSRSGSSKRDLGVTTMTTTTEGVPTSSGTIEQHHQHLPLAKRVRDVEDDDSLDYEYAVEIDFEQLEKDEQVRRRRNRCRCYFYWGILSVLLVCVILIASSTRQSRTMRSLDRMHPREYIGIRETAELLLKPPVPQYRRHQAVTTEQQEQSVVVGEVVVEGSPPLLPARLDLEQALDWIIHNDTIAPTDPTFSQRLVLVGVYFATHGESWQGNCGKHKLSWCAIQMDETLQSRRPWLTSYTECDWAGIVCDRFGQVVQVHLHDIVRECQVVPFAWLQHLPFLRSIRLTNASCEEIPDLSYHVGRHFRTIALDHNAFPHHLPASWYAALPNVRVLQLAGNFLSGTLSSDLARLSSLKRLDLRDNRLTGAIPNVFDHLHGLTHVWLNVNRFVGRIPPTLLQMGGVFTNNTVSVISDIDLGENRLSGTIPPLSNRTWNTLRFDNNQLSGSLPPTLIDRYNTIELDVSYNRLTGSISTSFGRWTHAARLHLSHNAFSGSLPDAIGRLPRLSEVTLDRNAFTGSVPDSWCQRDAAGLSPLEELKADCLAGDDVAVVGGRNKTSVETPCACCHVCCHDDSAQCRPTTIATRGGDNDD